MRVAGASNQAEAELIQGLLLEEGVPSVLRRTRGFDVPDFLAAGPREVLVPEAGAEIARELLRGTQNEPPPGAGGRPNPVKLVAAIALGGAGTAVRATIREGGGAPGSAGGARFAIPRGPRRSGRRSARAAPSSPPGPRRRSR